MSTYTSEFSLLVTSNPLVPTLDNNSEVYLSTYVDTWKSIHIIDTTAEKWGEASNLLQIFALTLFFW